jgi:heme exporter protein C
MWKFLHKLASPPHFYGLSAKMIPWFHATGLVAIIYGTIAGLFFATGGRRNE